MVVPRISLDQWRAFVAVVDAGGYAQAAKSLHKSQSAVTYAVQKLESQLGVKAFEIQGRRAVLTATGQLLHRRAQGLLEEAGNVEQAARTLSAGWEAEIRVAAEIIFPTWLLLDCLARFSGESPHTRIELIESVMGGTPEALILKQADLAIAASIPQGFSGDALMRARFVLAAHPDHPLHQLGRKLTMSDLAAHRHLVVRESGTRRDTRPSMEVEQRWTVGQLSTSIEAATRGHGFAWFPEERIRTELSAGALKPLPMREGGERFVELYLVFADREGAGSGTTRLAEIIREEVARKCPTRMRLVNQDRQPASA
jgi:DNA-binding transcriptional LysR family regulator